MTNGKSGVDIGERPLDRHKPGERPSFQTGNERHAYGVFGNRDDLAETVHCVLHHRRLNAGSCGFVTRFHADDPSENFEVGKCITECLVQGIMIIEDRHTSAVTVDTDDHGANFPYLRCWHKVWTGFLVWLQYGYLPVHGQKVISGGRLIRVMLHLKSVQPFIVFMDCGSRRSTERSQLFELRPPGA